MLWSDEFLLWLVSLVGSGFWTGTSQNWLPVMCDAVMWFHGFPRSRLALFRHLARWPVRKVLRWTANWQTSKNEMPRNVRYVTLGRAPKLCAGCVGHCNSIELVYIFAHKVRIGIMILEHQCVSSNHWTWLQCQRKNHELHRSLMQGGNYSTCTTARMLQICISAGKLLNRPEERQSKFEKAPNPNSRGINSRSWLPIAIWRWQITRRYTGNWD